MTRPNFGRDTLPHSGAKIMPELPPLSTIVIDNYDSFTFNLVQYLEELGLSVEVLRNDAMSARAFCERRPDFFVLSPGPSSPEKAGVCLELIRACFERHIPLLGVCLGHQAIGSAFGARVVRGEAPVHGKTAQIHHYDSGLFRGLPSPFTATRYHSLIVDEASLPQELEVTARTEDGIIMGLRHRGCAIEGVQFHPESVLTEYGHAMLANFVRRLLRKEHLVVDGVEK